MTPHEKKLIHNYQFRIDAATTHIDALRQVMKDQDAAIRAQRDAIDTAEELIAMLKDELRTVKEMQLMPTLN